MPASAVKSTTARVTRENRNTVGILRNSDFGQVEGSFLGSTLLHDVLTKDQAHSGGTASDILFRLMSGLP